LFENNVRKFVKTELTQRGTQIISTDVEEDSLRLRVVAVGREITEATRSAAEHRMEQYGLEGYRLRIIQGVQTDSILALNNQLLKVSSNRDADHQKLLELSAQNTDITARLEKYTRLEELAAGLRPELRVLFPEVNTLGLARMTEAAADTVRQQPVVIAIITTDEGRRLVHGERQKLQEWLKARTAADSLLVIER